MKIIYIKHKWDLDFYWDEWVLWKQRNHGRFKTYEFGPFMLTVWA